MRQKKRLQKEKLMTGPLSMPTVSGARDCFQPTRHVVTEYGGKASEDSKCYLTGRSIKWDRSRVFQLDWPGEYGAIQCAKMCLQDGNCQYFSYQVKSQRCQWKSIGTGEEKDVTSGSKGCFENWNHMNMGKFEKR